MSSDDGLLEDGWDNDDVNLDDDDFEDDENVVAGTTTIPNGWDDDDEGFLEDNDNNDECLQEEQKETKEKVMEKKKEKETTTGLTADAAAAAVVTNGDEDEGWGDDYDDVYELEGFDDEDKDADTNEEKPQGLEQPAVSSSSGWEQQDDVPQTPPSPPSPPPRRSTSQDIYADLEAYIQSLATMIPSINSVLEAEFNTPEKAAELVTYYAERPALAQYTIETELPRMDYVLVDASSNNNTPTHDKDEIAEYLQNVSSQQHDGTFLLARCANQSLLADLLQAMTGPDLLIRPQFLATAVAHKCRFQLNHVPTTTTTTQSPTGSFVESQVQLDLLLPTEHGRWKAAELWATIRFVPSLPGIQYQLQAVKVQPTAAITTNPAHGTNKYLQNVAHFLRTHHHEEIHPLSPTDVDNNTNFRDVFLQQSQSLLQTSADGMKSAWNEIESVAGFGSKLSQLPAAFLPDSLLEAAAAAEQEHSQQQAPAAATGQGPHPPPPPKQQQQRPSSLLGGLVRSGLSQLAKKVTLPDEDPGLYQGWAQQQQQQHGKQEIGHPHHPPAPAVAAAKAQLYHKESPPVVAATGPRRPPPPPPPPQPPHAQLDRTQQQNDHAQELYRKEGNAVPAETAEEALLTISQPKQHAASHAPAVEQQQHVVTTSQQPTSLTVDMEEEEEDAEGLMMGDGWDDDDVDVELELEEETSTDMAVGSSDKDKAAPLLGTPTDDVQQKSATTASSSPFPPGWVYDPETDIVPTRKRWVNPRHRPPPPPTTKTQQLLRL